MPDPFETNVDPVIEEPEPQDPPAEPVSDPEPAQDPPEPEEHPTTDAEWKVARLREQQKINDEAERRVRAKQAELDARITTICATQGAVHPLTGKPIQSAQEYAEALEIQTQREQQEQLKQAGLDPALIDRAIQTHPAILQAQMMAEHATRERVQLEIDQSLTRQFAEVQALNPELKTFEDLTKLPNFAEFDRLVRTGVDLATAYKASHFAEVRKSGVAAGKQAALNAVSSKSHHDPLPGSAPSGEDVEMSDRELSIFKEMFPDEPVEKLKKRYAATFRKD